MDSGRVRWWTTDSRPPGPLGAAAPPGPAASGPPPFNAPGAQGYTGQLRRRLRAAAWARLRDAREAAGHLGWGEAWEPMPPAQLAATALHAGGADGFDPFAHFFGGGSEQDGGGAADGGASAAAGAAAAARDEPWMWQRIMPPETPLLERRLLRLHRPPPDGALVNVPPGGGQLAATASP